MANPDVVVNLKINADKRGADEAAAAAGRFGSAAKKSAADAKGSLDGLQTTVGKVQGAFGALRNILTGFGIGALVTGMTAGLSRIISSFKAAEKSAAAFRDVEVRLAQENQIAKLANDTDRLAESTARAAQAENTRLEQIDREVAARRRLDAAKREAAKNAELDALDPEAGDYAERAAAIEKKYARQNAAAASADAVEDLVLERQKIESQAAQTDKAAAVKASSTKAIDAQIAALKRQKGAADVASVDLNENDKTGVLSAIGKTFSQLFTGDWGRMADAKTAEGDQSRLAAKRESAELSKRIAALEEQKRRAEAEADALRAEAENLRKRADGISPLVEAAQIEGRNAASAAARDEGAASRALAQRHKSLAEDADTYASAASAAELLAREKDDLKARIAREQSRKDAASLGVFRAQGDFDTARLAGDRAGQLSAYGNLQQAQGAALEVSRSADGAISALTKTLQSVEQRLKAAQNYLESQSKGASAAWAEAPAGS